MKKILDIIKFILACFITIIYVPVVIFKVLIPVIIGLSYLSITIIVSIVYLRTFFKLIAYLSNVNKPTTLIVLCVGLFTFVHLVKFMFNDLKNFRVWLWKWGKKYYDKLFADVR